MDIVDAIKDRLPLADWLDKRITFRRAGRTLVGPCSFHDEKTGSFTVWPDRDTFHCFGCGAGSDIFDYVQREQGCDFKEALKILAREAGIELHHKPEDLEAETRARERAGILGAAVEYYRKQLKPEHREYLHQRGFNDEFIDSYRFGWAPGATLRKALEDYDAKSLQEAGLLNHESRDFFWNRLIVPVYGRNNEIVNLVGRVLSEDAKPKYLCLAGSSRFINESGLRKTETVYLCEGEIDTLTLLQADLPVVGVGGSEGFKAEYADKFKRVQTVYVCADADAAGLDLVKQAGQVLGNRCRIVELPEGEDVNGWVGQKGNDIEALAQAARPYLDYLIERLPSEIEPDRLDAELEPVLLAVGQTGKASQDIYLRKIAKRAGIGVVAVREALRELIAKQEEKADTKHLANDGGSILWRDVRNLNPAQDLIDGTMYTTAFLDVLSTDPETGQRKLETLPYIVTSTREVFPLAESETYKRGLRIIPTKVPLFSIVGRRWSIAEDMPYSVKSYLDAGATVSPWEVYTETVNYLRHYIDYPSELYFDFMALWTVGTYFYNLYQAFPYVHLTGTKRVGKSLTLKIVAELAFNALFSSSMSSAAAYRAVEACSTTLLLDEAENLQKRAKDESQDDKIEILKAGYMKGPKAIRCTGDNHEPVGFDVYSPKMFGSIQAMDRILADRAITLTLARKKRNLPEFDFTEVKKQMARTRDKLYVLMLEHGKDINEEIRAGIGWDGVRDRERELWTPILTLATFFDNYQIDEAGGHLEAEKLLTTKMRMLAFQKGEEKLAKEQAEQTEMLMLEGLMDYLRTAAPVEGNWYVSAAVLSHFQGIEELSWLKNWQQVVRELERVTVIQNKKRDLTRIRVDGKQARVIRLDQARIQDIAGRYGVPAVLPVPPNPGGM